MTAASYSCCSDGRRLALRERPELNGIDVVDLVVPVIGTAVTQVLLTFVNPIAALPAVDGLRLAGTDHRPDIPIVAVQPTDDPRAVVLTLAVAADPATYVLSLVTDARHPEAPPDIDPALAALPVDFAGACPAIGPCDDDLPCPPAPVPEPNLDYLAKDYEGFRRLLFDRLALTQPGWREPNVADVQTMLVELSAHLADRISYRQDAVATEAYLGTARRRISVRRHARLVDYRIGDGTNARAWVQLQVAEGTRLLTDDDHPIVPRGTRFLTNAPGEPCTLDEDAATLALDAAGSLEFQAVLPLTRLVAAHDAIRFHTWSGTRCCLPAGSTSATLAGHLGDLRVGDVLVLVEQRDPLQGSRAKADRRHRHAVRVLTVDAGPEDAPRTDPITDEPITEITWAPADALPFPLTVSVAVPDPEHLHEPNPPLVEHDDAAMALGNIVLVDHGRTVRDDVSATPANRFRPRLPAGPVTQVRQVLVTRTLADGSGTTERWESVRADAPAVELLDPPGASALPDVQLRDEDGRTWVALPDLLDGNVEHAFVVEVDEDEVAWLRLQDPDRPADVPGTGTLHARFRVGVGAVGNVGIGAISQLVDAEPAPPLLVASLVAVANPTPATGGTDPETIEAVRQRAPEAFRVQERAVTAEDYGRRAEQFGLPRERRVQRAVAALRWTGSWYTVQLAVDRVGGLDVDDRFEAELRAYLDAFRLAGHDLEIVGARAVPLEIGIAVRLDADQRRDRVRAELLDIFSNRRLDDGRLGFFHPDNLTFGQPVHLSAILATAHAVPGVAQVTDVTRFQRYRLPGTDARESGTLALQPSEVARLDNDPSRPERGRFFLDAVEGGR